MDPVNLNLYTKRENIVTTHKTCTKCKQLKPVNLFDEKPNVQDGKTSHCKECRSNAYHLRTYKYQCQTCSRGSHFEGDCKPCLIAGGLKRCRVCLQIKLIELDFYNTRSVCKQCLKNQRLCILTKPPLG